MLYTTDCTKVRQGSVKKSERKRVRDGEKGGGERGTEKRDSVVGEMGRKVGFVFKYATQELK